MKKFKKIAYVVLIIIIAILSFTIYTSASKNNVSDQNDKTISEIKYIESKLVDLLNTMNNIESRNYNISVSEMSKKTTEETSGGSSSSSSGSESSSGGSSGGSESSSSSSGGGESGGDSDSSGTSSDSQESEKDNKKFEMKLSGILTNSEDINWDFIKSEVEIMYSSIPAITMDLYKIELNQEDILNFNKEYDTLAVAVKEEKKEDTLTQLSKLYSYIPKFLKNTSEDEVCKKVIETKAYILAAYAKLDAKEWNKIENDVNKAIEVYSQLLSNTDVDNSKQYTISKGYIMLNELQNAVKIKDVEVFLIKYKNIIEEFNCI